MGRKPSDNLISEAMPSDIRAIFTQPELICVCLSLFFSSHESSMWQEYLGAIALTWYGIVVSVITIGTTQLFRYFTQPTPKATSPELPLENVPHVTVIRPVKGLEPCLYECLAATFQQTYPRDKLTVYFCVSSHDDPAVPTLERLVADFPHFDSKVYIEDNDPRLNGQHGGRYDLGPNPKIRNMSRAYNEAKGDIVWIADCNVWVSKSACGLMVDQLCGLGSLSAGRKYKFVHQLPLAVDITWMSTSMPHGVHTGEARSLASYAGGLLDELFLSTAHAKFYTAISTVAIAPCIVGKSNMFRRSHLAALTQPSAKYPDAKPGVDFFSNNICEDHLIGDLLWKSPIPASVREAAELEGRTAGETPPAGSDSRSWGHHSIVPAPPCIQPLAGISAPAYAARRARWLRVRKFTVPLATLVEPGTESLLASACGAYALTTVPWVHERMGVPQTWAMFWGIWWISMLAWGAVDWHVWKLLQGWKSEGNELTCERTQDAPTPFFVGSGVRKTFGQWFGSWLGRELLAFPVWAWAVFGGTEVIWRGRRFWVGYDMKVHAVDNEAVPNGKGIKGV